MKLKLNQKGMIGPVEIGAIILVIAVVGFTGFRIGNARTQVEEITANAQNDEAADEAARLALKEQAEEDAKEIEIPKDESSVEKAVEEPKTTEVPKQTPAETKPVETEPVKEKKDITYIEFNKGGAGQSGDTVSASARLESEQTGTCYVKFYKEGHPKVFKEHALSNAKECAATFAISEFEVAGDWDIYIWFVSSDGKVEAHQASYPVDITL